MKARWRQRGVTMVELLVVGVVLTVLIAIVFVVASDQRTKARRKPSATQLRGIYQGLITSSQGSKYLPGTGPYVGLQLTREGTYEWYETPLTATGASAWQYTSSRTSAYPAYRYAILLNGGFFTPDYLINPIETLTKTPVAAGSEVTPANFSYAMLRLDTDARKAEWRETLNPAAPVLSDRMIGTVAAPQSVWTKPGEVRWAGHVVFNDGRGEWIEADDPIVRNTRFGDGATVAADHLFIPDDADADGNIDSNAAMVYATDRDHENQK